MERDEGEWRAGSSETTPFSHSDGSNNHNHNHNRHHHNFSGEPNDSTGPYLNGNSNYSGHKRNFSNSNNNEFGSYVKLYIVGIPRTSTEHDISEVFGEFGDIVEVVLLKDKRTGTQQECCFVKYASIEHGERAIGALHGQYTFPGVMNPVLVKYAVGERERLGSIGAHVHKLYVGSLNRQALKWEIEEIFSPFGVIEEVFVVRDEFKQNRGCAFVQFACREMAIAAIHALHGTYVMRGCDQPLIVRFADPKKPRTGDSRPAPLRNDSSSGHMLSNEIQPMKPSHFKTTMSSIDAASADHLVSSNAEMDNTVECDWSEHVSPDGDLYYYNCVTFESRWEKPEDYAHYEQELDNLEQQIEESKLQALFSPGLSEAQEG